MSLYHHHQLQEFRDIYDTVHKFRPVWSSTNTLPKAMSEVTMRPEKQATNGHVTGQELVLQPK